MRVHICGSRGSTPATGPDFVRYGGNTSCVAVSRDGDVPHLLLDAGTGLRNVWEHLEGAAFDGSILLSHLHWDHTHGLPFFRAGDVPDARVDLYLPAPGSGEDAETVLARGMSPPSFPIRPSQLRGDWRFHTLGEGRFACEGFTVLAREVPHKGGRTFGYRIADDSASVAYLSDHHPFSLGPGPTGHGSYHDAVRELADGVDLLIHDAQYTREEFAERAHFGHATFDYALGVAEVCDVGRLLLFHHDPFRSDDELDDIVKHLPSIGREVVVAVEGMSVTLGSAGRSA